MKILPNSKKKKIIKQLNQQGIKINNLPYLLIQFGHDKLRLYSGNLSKEDISIFDRELKIEDIGLYFAKQEKDKIVLTRQGKEFIKNQKFS